MCYFYVATQMSLVYKNIAKRKINQTGPPWVLCNTDGVKQPASLNLHCEDMWACSQPLCKHFYTQALLCLVVLRFLSEQPTDNHRLQVGSDHIRRESKRGLEHHPINTVSSKLLVSSLSLFPTLIKKKKKSWWVRLGKAMAPAAVFIQL